MSSEQVRARLRPFGISFYTSLTDLIKGIRLNNHDPDRLTNFLEISIQECRKELKTTDLELKSMAVLKLAYLEMYGFDMSWCSFHVLEVMSSSKFQHKRIGYLAAIQILQRQNNEDALMLMTNLLKKDINSSNFVESGMAISGIAAIVTNELAQDICDDMVKMLNHSKPFIRKKAVLAMYKIFLKFPEALRSNFNRLIEKLDDEDNSVVSATVNVICELANKNPKNYVDLAPRLFGLLKDTHNNWMVIRLLKLLSSLSLIEPRLKYILLPAILELMESTKALSLVYESISCILNGQMLTSEDTKIAKVIINKLIQFLENDDQDLKYVGLLAFIKTCKIHKDLIKKHDKIILASIYDNDLTIREKSLEIIDSLVTEKNIVLIVTRLLIQLVPVDEQSEKLSNINDKSNDVTGDLFLRTNNEPILVTEKYKYQVITKIIQICSMDNYQNIPNFRWYLGVLKDIINLNKDNKIANVDKIISEQFVDMAIRVPSIRGPLVSACIELVVLTEEYELFTFYNGLKNCIWIIGEYYTDYIAASLDSEDEDEDEDTSDEEEEDDVSKGKITGAQIIEKITNQSFLKRNSSLEIYNSTVPIYIQSMAKLYGKYCNSLDYDWSKDDLTHVIGLTKHLIGWLESYQQCTNFEVQERSLSFAEILKLVLESLQTDLEADDDVERKPAPYFLSSGYSQLFNSYQIKPVSSTIQQAIPLPSDLDLDKPINEDSIVEFNRVLSKILEGDKKTFKNNGYDAYDGDEDDEDDDQDMIFESESENLSESDDDGYDEDIEHLSNDKKLSLRKKKERLERLKDDPFYIFGNTSSTPSETTTSQNNDSVHGKKVPKTRKKPIKPKKIKKEKVLILGDEEGSIVNTDYLKNEVKEDDKLKKKKKDKSKLIIDSSVLDNFDLIAKDDEEVHTGKGGFEEYDVEKLRKQFESSNMDEASEKKIKKKSSKPKKTTTANLVELQDATAVEATKSPSSVISNSDVTVVKKKPKKPKKKVAVILD